MVKKTLLKVTFKIWKIDNAQKVACVVINRLVKIGGEKEKVCSPKYMIATDSDITRYE
jgi:hypothetical protein